MDHEIGFTPGILFCECHGPYRAQQAIVLQDGTTAARTASAPDSQSKAWMKDLKQWS